MRVLTIVLLSVCLLAGAVAAGDKYVPDSTPTGICNHFPFNPTWTGSNGEWRYQAVYTSTQLGTTPFVITGLSLAPCGTGTFTAGKFQIRMNNLQGAHSTNFDTNIGTPTVVRTEGSVTWNTTQSTWSPIKLDCPHTYDGSSNLVVEVRYTGGGVTGSFTGPVARASVAQRYYAWGTGAYTLAVATGSGVSAFKIRLTVADVTPSTLAPTPGSSVTLLLDSYPDAGQTYVCASSLGTGPIPLGCWLLNLTADGVFFVSAQNLVPALFANYQGTLNASGQAKAALNIPSIPALVGTGVYTAFVTIDASGLRVVSSSGFFQIS